MIATSSAQVAAIQYAVENIIFIGEGINYDSYSYLVDNQRYCVLFVNKTTGKWSNGIEESYDWRVPGRKFVQRLDNDSHKFQPIVKSTEDES